MFHSFFSKFSFFFFLKYSSDKPIAKKKTKGIKDDALVLDRDQSKASWFVVVGGDEQLMERETEKVINNGVYFWQRKRKLKKNITTRCSHFGYWAYVRPKVSGDEMNVLHTLVNGPYKVNLTIPGWTGPVFENNC